MRGLATLALVLALCGSAGPAQGQFLSIGDFDFSLTETFYADYHMNQAYSVLEDVQDPETGKPKKEKVTRQYRYFDLKNRFNLAVRSSLLQAGVRLDYAGFFGPDSGDAGSDFSSQFDNDLSVEKFYARVRHGGLGVEVGDVYATFGKGISLMVKKVDELSSDATIRGVKAWYNGRLAGATLIGGLTNMVNVGDKVEQFLPDPNDLVAGVEGRLHPLNWLHISAHGSMLVDARELPMDLRRRFGFLEAETFPDDSVAKRPQTLFTVGPTLSMPDIFGSATLLAEYDAMLQTWTRGDEADHPDLLAAQAVYASMTFDWEFIHLLGEVKWYESHLEENHSATNLMGREVEGPSGETDFVYYAALPPLDDEALLYRNDRPYDVMGGRLRADLEIPPISGIPFVSYTHHLDTSIGPELSTDYYLRHVRTGWEQRLDSFSVVANVSGGYRMEDFEFTKENMYHFEGDLHFPLYGPHSMELAGRLEAYERPDQKVEYSIVQGTATYSWAPWLGLSFTYEYSDQPGGIAEASGHFYSGEAIFRFLQGSYAKVFAGTSRGGLKCAGGMCRTFPPFEGVKGELTLRF